MPEFPSAHIHRIHGHVLPTPRRWDLPLLRFLLGIWPATLTGVIVATVAVVQTL